MAFAIFLPSAWAKVQPSPPVPAEIASLWVPGKLNVVEFADFQCPYCRELHPSMSELLHEYADQVHFVRLNVPLASHSNARAAARAYCCADNQGKGEAMADALFRANDLSPEGCERLAVSLGLSAPEYRACIASAATEARIDKEYQQAKNAGLAGLPTVWIGDKGFVGLQSLVTLRSAFAEASHGKLTRLPTALLWAAFGTMLAVFGAIAMRVRAAPTTR
jgi:protein-disulfide isomerase